MSGDPDQEYFSDGITEEIITELTQFRSLQVMARNSTFQYKGKSVDVRTIGEELGARYVVEGSVRKAGGKIRVSAQLLDATDGKHLWAESYDRDLTASDIFEVQDDITEKIVATVAGTYGAISRAGLKEARKKQSGSIESYECVLRAMAYEQATTAEMHLRARQCLEQAVEQDPDYAEAWARLALLYVDEFSMGFSPLPGDPLDRVFSAAHNSIALDTNNQDAHQALSSILYFRKDPAFFDKAERALLLNPNNPEAFAWMGHYIMYAGHWERGLALVQKAMAMNPAHPNWLYTPISIYYYRKGEYAKALSYALRIELPGWYWYHIVLAMDYAQLGRKAEARANVRELLKVYPDFETKALSEFRKWMWEEELIEHMVEGLTKAGLEIPPEE
jgi:TolB-like protein